jgi:tRNA(Arg) A34 adenosine deaminase TadA
MGQMQGPEKPAWLAETDPLHHYWDKSVGELANAPVSPWQFDGKPEMYERYQLHALLVFALLHEHRNGNKYGPDGQYPQRSEQRLIGEQTAADVFYAPAATYLGHNIACIAVDGTGEIIDFEFNHNEVYASSMEHAESRLVRRVFSLTKIYDDWYTTETNPPEKFKYTDAMELVTIFTSLESCAQCAGIMALGGVRDVVYLQVDPGMSFIGNILYNLTRTAEGQVAKGKITSPYPLSGRAFGFGYTDALEDGYETFREGVSEANPFFEHARPAKSGSPSITSFLCTDEALGIFAAAHKELKEKLERFRQIREEFAKDLNTVDNLEQIGIQLGTDPKKVDLNPLWARLGTHLKRERILDYPDYCPPIYRRDGKEVAGRVALSNAAVLRNVERFWDFAKRSGHRGAPHKI